MQKKKLAFAIITISIIITFVPFVAFTINNKNRDFRFFSMSATDNELYIEQISFSFSDSGSIFNQKFKDALNEFDKKNKDIVNMIFDAYNRGEYVEPTNIKAKITVESGQTIVLYYGTATTKSGEIDEINHQFTVDYIFTKDIPIEFS
ncbi:MAG: hypothetical protein MJ212_03905 [Alphaproteobacteria bacterium]|nr:hypothetical protein [Alphaproteobacteria bacterium]